MEKIYFMYCETDTVTILDEKSHEILTKFEKDNSKKLTFYCTCQGYICCNMKIYLHQIIMNLYGQGTKKDTLSVDHIDRDPKNNKYDNLRIVDYDTQQSNKKGTLPNTKRARKHNAISLPDGINQTMIPKYVYYCRETINRGKHNESYREFFRIEKHPKLKLLNKKCISSSKSMKISIIDKLIQINNKLNELNKGIEEL